MRGICREKFDIQSFLVTFEDWNDSVCCVRFGPLRWLGYTDWSSGSGTMLFDLKILRSEEFDIPIVCVGNLTVGGTGKTPVTEYLIEYFASRYNIAVLSRGYKRKTRGFVLSDVRSSFRRSVTNPNRSS